MYTIDCKVDDYSVLGFSVDGWIVVLTKSDNLTHPRMGKKRRGVYATVCLENSKGFVEGKSFYNPHDKHVMPWDSRFGMRLALKRALANIADKAIRRSIMQAFYEIVNWPSLVNYRRKRMNKEDRKEAPLLLDVEGDLWAWAAD